MINVADLGLSKVISKFWESSGNVVGVMLRRGHSKLKKLKQKLPVTTQRHHGGTQWAKIWKSEI